MKTKYIVYGMMMVLFAGCSKGDDLLLEQTVVPGAEVKNALDDENVTREDLMGMFPIEFAGVGFGGSATIEESTSTRGSVNITDSRTDNLGMFCISSAKILDAADDAAVKLSWSGNVGTKLNLLNLWQDNAKAHIVPALDGYGRIMWDEQNVPRYYPSVDFFKYTFIAYHPYTEAIMRFKSGIYAYMMVDGDDDVVYAMADAPHATNSEADDYAYSNEYYRRLVNAGVGEITDDHKPFFNFKHLMSSIRFKVQLKEASSEHTFRVDSICFSDFINVIRLMLVKEDNGSVQFGGLTYGYDPVNLDESIKPYFNGASGTKGSFWLREADGSSIREKKVNGVYKYIVNNTDWKEVGDCIMIPPVVENITSATILLKVFLSDEKGNRTVSLVTLPRPGNGWEAGKQYVAKLSISTPTNLIGLARGEVTDWDIEEFSASD